MRRAGASGLLQGRSGERTRPSSTHQLVTNAFRSRHAYGQPAPSPERAQDMMMKVYSEYPIPQLIGLPNP